MERNNHKNKFSLRTGYFAQTTLIGVFAFFWVMTFPSQSAVQSQFRMDAGSGVIFESDEASVAFWRDSLTGDFINYFYLD